MLLYKQVTTTEELQQVLELQSRNLKQHIPLAEKEKEGFVTLQHSLEILALMHAIQPSVIAVDEGRVIGYALAKPIQQYKFYVMGQVCIDKSYRGTGVFAALYEKHRELFSQQ